MADQSTGAQDENSGYKRYFNSPTLSDIILRLGPNGEETFYAHKIVLCSHSSWFRAALTGKFEESGEKELLIQGPDHVSAEAVKAMLHYMYTEESPTYGSADLGNEENNNGLADLCREATFWCEVYVVADYYDIQDLKGTAFDIFDDMVVTIFEWPAIDANGLEYNQQEAEDSIGNLITDVYLHPELLAIDIRNRLLRAAREEASSTPSIMLVMIALAKQNTNFGCDIFCAYAEEATVENDGAVRHLDVIVDWTCSSCSGSNINRLFGNARFCSQCGSPKPET